MRLILPAGALAVSMVAGQALAQPVAFQNATATFSQTFTGNFFASGMIDGSITPAFGDGWAVFNNGTTSTQTAALETVTDLTAPAIRLDMYQVYGTNHTLGRFRFSVTADDRSTFCDGLQTGGDVSANWTVISPSSLDLPAGVTYSILGDGSVLIAGSNPATATYSGVYDLPFGNITGLRIEALEHPSFGTNGPGRQGNGNFVLTELVGAAVPAPSVAAVLLLGGMATSRRRR
jgi:hypothetical protein